jgi:hypothetical protein
LWNRSPKREKAEEDSGNCLEGLYHDQALTRMKI